ncbi:unnamed protein product [Paramecium pentaurelia]|uniref:Uncharacterized protein n=1 Tax=Paramecium pentaurelia TaxID=43138 RepID=A0A8S1WNZ7_9CILI|nr:unnamed protein product [Paramecium pentaurelia]
MGSNWDYQGWLFYKVYGGPITRCGDTNIFGGYGAFAKQTLISSKFTLPPHYSLRISFDLWKVDSWDGEIVKIVFDSEINQRSFILEDGQQICGHIHEIYLEYNIPFSITIPIHNSQTLVVIMTSTLDSSPLDESWGFKDFKIEILQCPKDCVFCRDQTSCYFWINVESYWNSQINSEGWMINGNIPLTSSECNLMWIAGILQKGQRIEKIIDLLSPHFRVQISFKLWTIGEWSNELFKLEIDDEEKYSILITSDNFIYSQCQAQKVRITNIDVSSLHKSTQIKLLMKTEKYINDVAGWGLSQFDLFVAICSYNCKECYGELKSQCSICRDGWIMVDIGCIAPPLECSQIRITEYQNTQVDLMTSFRIRSDEIAQNISEIGQKTIILNKQIASINFQIQVKCLEKQIVKSFFRSCYSCDQEQYKFSNQCQNNVIIYHPTFLQEQIDEKELIITISQQQLQIVQVATIEETKRQFLILEIEI